MDEADRSAIRLFADVFSDVIPDPIEKWEMNFSRDVNPKNEIRAWTKMAAEFRLRTTGRDLSLAQKKAAFADSLLAANARTPVKVVVRR